MTQNNAQGAPSRAHAIDLILLVLCNFMFGAQYPATKAAVMNMGPVLLSILTFGIATVCLIPFMILESRAHPEQPPSWTLFQGKNFFPFFMATAMGFIPASVILAWGIERSLAANAALLTLSIPIFTAMLASLVREEQMTSWRWLSFALGITGAIISSDIDWHHLSVFSARYLIGNALILGGCAGSAFTNVYSKGLLERFRPVRLLVVSYIFTALLCVPLWLWQEPVSWSGLVAYPARTWVGLGILGFFSWGLSMILFFRVLSRLEVTQVALSNYLIPFFGILLSALFLNEKISGAIIAGGILVITGTSLILFADHRATRRNETLQQATVNPPAPR